MYHCDHTSHHRNLTRFKRQIFSRNKKEFNFYQTFTFVFTAVTVRRQPDYRDQKQNSHFLSVFNLLLLFLLYIKPDNAKMLKMILSSATTSTQVLLQRYHQIQKPSATEKPLAPIALYVHTYVCACKCVFERDKRLLKCKKCNQRCRK